MYHIVICDSDKSFIEFIKQVILKSGLREEEVQFSEYYLGKDILDELNEIEFCDLLILDMRIKDLDSYEIARSFRKVFKSSILVFSSATCAPTDKCFKVTTYRYLYKNYSNVKMLSEMKEIIKKVKNNKNNNDDFCIIGNYYCNIVKLNPKDILYIENSKRGSMIHICDEKIEYEFEKKLTTRYKLAELYEKLNKYGFEYGHNSYLINLKYVSKLLSKGEVKLLDGTILSISRSKLKKFRTALLNEIDCFKN